MQSKKDITLYTGQSEMLRAETKIVEKIDAELLAVFDDMIKVMSSFDGLAVAGPQIGILKKIVIIDLEVIEIEEKQSPSGKKYLKLFNPEILYFSNDKCKMEEGCLSFPTIYYDVERPTEIKLKYMDEEGKVCEINASGLLSRCIQHEVDHLNGKLFIDYLSPLKRKIALGKLKKLNM